MATVPAEPGGDHPMLIGVLGGGQLGRMLALAGVPLGLSFRFLDPLADASAAALGEHVACAWDDAAGVAAFADGLDLATFEFENVPLATAAAVAARVPLRPGTAALAAKQDRLDEKRLLRALGIPVADFLAVDDRASLDRAVAALGLPAVLKTRRDGYDGKGQALLRTPGDLAPAWTALGGRPLILERFVPFVRELSVVAVRALDGDQVFYPLVENHHRGGILRRTVAPAPDVGALQAEAQAHAGRLLVHLDYVGALAIEFFAHDGHLIANEFAPRVHNSGHWSIEGATTSQFANHLRAIAGLPLGSTAARGHCVMLNLIGDRPDPAAVLAVPGAHFHHYGKAARPGRKVGHLTVVADSAAEAAHNAQRLLALVDDPAPAR